MSTDVFSGQIGAFRIVTFILGIIILAAVGGSAFSGWNAILLVTVFILIIFTLVWVILSLVDVVKDEGCLKTVDMFFNLIGGGVILVAVLIFLVEVIITLADRNSRIGDYPARVWVVWIIWIILGIIDGVLYLLIGMSLRG